MARIIGIDPGLRSSGFGVVETQDRRIEYIACGTIKSGEGSLPQRLHTLYQGVCKVVEQYQPEIAAVEIVFVNVNPQSTLLLGQARGALITALTSCGLSVTEYTALQLKKSLVGHGKAGKEQVQYMVKRLLKLPATPGPDAADALALAICHHHNVGEALGDATQNSIAKQLGGSRLRTRGGRIVSID